MPVRSILSAAALLLGCTVAQAGEPADLVRSFYVPKVIAGFEPAVRGRFTKPASELFARNDQLASADGLGCLDFALSIDAQDYDQATLARTLELQEDMIDATTTAVSALFQLFPDDDSSRKEIVWTLLLADGVWKVSDIASPASDWWLSSFECG